MDNGATIGQLKTDVIGFRERRNWRQFHDPKNLSIGLAVEAAELQEIFLWKSNDEVQAIISSAVGIKRIREELADVLVFLLYLAEACEVDLSEAVSDKLKINEAKYPVDTSYNSNRKYTELGGN